MYRLLILIALTAAACGDLKSPGARKEDPELKGREELKKAKFQARAIDGESYLQIWSNMEVTTSLNTEADLQYVSKTDFVYLVVLKESRKDFDLGAKLMNFEKMPKSDTSVLAKYSFQILEHMRTNGKKFEDSLITEKLVNGMPTRIYQFRDQMEYTDIYYQAALIRSPEYYYQIIAWTFQSQKDRYKYIMRWMLESLQEGRPPVKKEVIEDPAIEEVN